MEENAKLKSDKPKTYYDNEHRRNSNFFFISYSHKDEDCVFSILNQLYDASVNYWYDVNLDPGDKWNSRVKEIMCNQHCHGAIVFLSKNSLLSNAVQQEIRAMQEIAETRSFRIIPVIKDFDSAKDLILSVAKDNDEFFQTGYDLFKNITKDSIYLFDEQAVERIIKLSEKESVIAGFGGSFLADLHFVSQNGKRSLLEGQYPKEEDGVLQDIEWIEVCKTGDLFYFVSKYCLDFVDIDHIDTAIERIKQSVSSRSYVEDVKLIDETFIKDYAKTISEALPTNYADRNRQQLLRLFWVLEGDGENSQALTLYSSNNNKLNANIQLDSINAGLRLVLIINNNKIGDKKNA